MIHGSGIDTAVLRLTVAACMPAVIGRAPAPPPFVLPSTTGGTSRSCVHDSLVSRSCFRVTPSETCSLLPCLPLSGWYASRHACVQERAWKKPNAAGTQIVKCSVSAWRLEFSGRNGPARERGHWEHNHGTAHPGANASPKSTYFLHRSNPDPKGELLRAVQAALTWRAHCMACQ
jgi:hypothetical protein